MKTTNPFPGMNPFLEIRWADAHTALIGYVRDALSENLPADLSVIAEEGLHIDSASGAELNFRADVAISQQTAIRLPEMPPAKSGGSSTVTLAKPEIIRAPTTHRWLEIRHVDDRLITVIEIVSPSNKTLGGAKKFAERQENLLHSGVNIVDIDLIRGGVRPIPETYLSLLKPDTDRTTYVIMSGLGNDPQVRNVYYCPLSERLPAITIPLRPTDEVLTLDLQPLVDRCYQMGRYWQVSQRGLPGLPLEKEERDWMQQLLVNAGLVD
jgi:hypothetical protein